MRPSILVIVPLVAALLLLSVTPTAAARECRGVVDTHCGHVTADGLCYLYVGVGAGGCVVYGDAPTPECDQEVETSCDHWSSPGPCVLYVGGADGRCIVYG